MGGAGSVGVGLPTGGTNGKDVILLVVEKNVDCCMKKKAVNATKIKIFSFLPNFIVFYFTIILLVGVIIGVAATHFVQSKKQQVLSVQSTKESYWFMLHRKSNIELLLRGIPGSQEQSALVRVFKVKTGVPGEKPTPLPKLLGKDYWIITKKEESKDNPETAPYFISLNIPVTDEEPYGPTSYTECINQFTGEKTQCNWILPGSFGLHGVNNDASRLSDYDLGSSGCIRHSDEDITYLYNLLNPEKEEIRYYIEDI